MTVFRIVDAARERERVDVTIRDGVIDSIAPTTARRSQTSASVIDADGAAIIPALHDHHIHLAAAAAARAAIDVGPPTVSSVDELASALAHGSRDSAGWRRAVNYHESVGGDLDATALDAIVADGPVRLQHRSGAAWILNSAALRQLALDGALGDEPSGVERHADGTATGRVFRLDSWLRQRMASRVGASARPDLRAVASDLAAFGVGSVTDATPHASSGDLVDYAAWCRAEARPLAVTLMVGPGVDVPTELDHRVRWTKLVLGDDELPDPDVVADWVAHSHAAGRPVAVHSVTGASMAITIAALTASGVRQGDRIEHAAVAAPSAVAALAALGVRVVTQPGLVACRGDSYLDDVDDGDRPDLWRAGSLMAAGIRVGAGSDAPYGPLDPWLAVDAAVSRLTPSQRLLGADERVDRPTALDWYLGAADDPGGPPRRVEPGARADLCLVDPTSGRPALTVLAGDPNQGIITVRPNPVPNST